MIKGINEYYLSHAEYENLILNLIEKIRPNKNKYKYVCGIPRGGLIPTIWISHHLEIPMISSSFFVDLITKDLIEFKKNDLKHILIIDDLTDSGETILGYIKYCDTATLYIKPWSQHIPTYCVDITDKIIIFPYEKK